MPQPFNVLNSDSVYVLRGVLLKTRYVSFSVKDLPTRRLFRLFDAEGQKLKEIAVPHTVDPDVFAAARKAIEEFKKVL